MHFLLGWAVKLGVLAIVAFAVTGNLRLPQTVLGFEVPEEARQWADRNGHGTDIVGRTQAGFKQISDSLR